MARSIGNLWILLRRALSGAEALLRTIPPGMIATRRERRLRLCETLSLGEKRFLAVVQVERQEFLVGGSGNSICLLAQLPTPPASPSRASGQIASGSQQG